MGIPYKLDPLGVTRENFTRLRYIQSHGNKGMVGEYIDTGWYFPENADSFRIEAKLCFMEANNHTAMWPVACGVNNSNGGATLQYYKIQGYPQPIANIVYGNADAAQANNEIMVPASDVDMYSPFTVDMQYAEGTTTILTNGGNMLQWTRSIAGRARTTCWIFSLNCGRTSSSFAVDMRLYYFKITQDGAIVRDFIPVLDGNGVPCLFDRANKAFYYNLAANAIGFIPGY